ncbi:Na+/H+ antiporter NhaA, partial [Pedobacter steynii]
MRSGQIGGVLLMICAVISLIIANSSHKDNFSELLLTDLGFALGSISYSLSVSAWINDALMAIFFLLVGLEIKRELVEGELSSV